MIKDILPIDPSSWRKSNNSLESNCVEVGTAADGTRGVRDSEDRDGAQLRFTAGQWTAFVKGVKDGQFDN
jgi:hypothetical protein